MIIDASVKKIDISFEPWRVYHYSDGREFKIFGQTLYITPDGGHRVVTEGTAFIIARDWVSIEIPETALKF